MSDAGLRRRNRRLIFGRTPEPLLFDPAYSANARVVWALLDRRIDQRADSDTEGCAFPGREWLAERLGRSLDTVDRALKELEDGGWIEVERPAGGRRNEYVLCDEPGELVRTSADQWSASMRTSRSAPVRTTSKESKGNESKGTKPPAEAVSQLRLDDQPAAPDGAGKRTPASVRRRLRSAPTAPPHPNDIAARAIADRVSARRRPAPMANVRQQMPVYRKALDAGWTVDAVEAAAMKASTITTGALEFELNRATAPARTGKPDFGDQFTEFFSKRRGRTAAPTRSTSTDAPLDVQESPR